MAFKFNPFTGKLDTVADPGGVDTNVQFNDSNAFGGVNDLTYNKTSKVLTNKGDLNLDDGSAFATTLQTVTPTTNRTITFPDASGIVGLVGGSSGQIQYNNSGVQGGLSTLVADGSGNLTLSGRMTNTFNSLASAPAKSWTGTWFTGGTATTTKPHLLLEPTGTTSTNWSTSGTGLGINASSGFAGNFLDMQLNGTSRFRVDRDGSTTFLGNLTSSVAGAVSVSAAAWTGTAFSGGTTTTTKPLILFEPTGTTSNNWNTAGTYWGGNVPATFNGSILDFQQNAARRLRFTADGALIINTEAATNVASLQLTFNNAPRFQILNTSAGAIVDVINGGGTTVNARLDGRDNFNSYVNITGGNFGIGTQSPTAKLTVVSDTIRITVARTPASATATGNAGDICWDANYIYVCTATNTWKRSALSSW